MNLVVWVHPDSARLLRFADDVNAAVTEGRLTAEHPGIVVNMPMLRWPGGER